MKRFVTIYILLLATAVGISMQSKTAKASDCLNPDGTHNDIYEFEEIGREEATCESDGVIHLRCAGCQQYTKDQVIEKKGHDYSVLVKTVNKTTCVDGYSEYKCSRCDKTEIRDIVKASHVIHGEVLVWPNCTEPGRQRLYCVYCDYSFETEISPTGGDHRWVVIENAPPHYCDTDAYRKLKCARCDKIIDELIPAGSHSMAESITYDANCCKTGEKLVYCKNFGCDYSYIEIIPTNDNHNWSAYWEPKCVGEITQYWECTWCHKKEERIIVGPGHEWQYFNKVEPDCVSEGGIYYKCDRCGDFKCDPIPALGHDWETEDSPNCGFERAIHWECKRCPQTKYEVIPATGEHEYIETITKKPSCGVEGEKTITCANCTSYRAVEAIPPLAAAHEWQIKSSHSATCMDKGATVERCSICGSEKTTETPAIGHKWDEGVIQEDGTVLFTCANDSSHTKLTLGDKPSETDSLGTIKEEPNEPENKVPEEEPADNRTEDSGNNAEQKQEEKNDVIKAEEPVDVVIVETQESNNATEENGTDAKGGPQPLIIIILSAIPIAGCAVAVKMGWLQKIIRINK